MERPLGRLLRCPQRAAVVERCVRAGALSQGRPSNSTRRGRLARAPRERRETWVCCASPEGDEDEGPDLSKRGRARPSTPDDTPLRDGNRDRLLGLLTERATKTLMFYTQETNVHLYHWLNAYQKANPIPREGQWDDVSGDTFLSTLMLKPPEQARGQPHVDPMYDCTKPLTVDPRQIAQRIMDIRMALAKELIEELHCINEENMRLLRKTLMASLSVPTTGDSIDEAAAEDAKPEDKTDA